MADNGPMTGEGVVRDLKRIKAQIGKKVEKSPGVQGRVAAGKFQDNQRPRQQANMPWGRALKKRMAETRDTKRTEPSPAIKSRPANQRPNTGAVDQLYSRSKAITPVAVKPDSRMFGVDAGGGQK